MTRPPYDPAVLAEGLRVLADELESGARAVPLPGTSVRRIGGGAPVVPIVVHDALCGWRVASRQEETDPDVLACAGCGMAYLVRDAEIAW